MQKYTTLNSTIEESNIEEPNLRLKLGAYLAGLIEADGSLLYMIKIRKPKDIYLKY